MTCGGGCTALYVAAQCGHAAVATALLKAGARVDLARDDGATPLFFAALKGHAAVVTALLDGGAAINRPMHDGSTALVNPKP